MIRDEERPPGEAAGATEGPETGFTPEVLGELRRRAKAVLRKRARGLRAAIPAEAIAERSARIAAVLEAQPELVKARSVALFYPIEGRNEVDLRPLDPRLRRRGVRIAYPSIDPDTRIMTFRFCEDPEAMEERGMGFCEPLPEAEEASSLDVVVVPALQVDAAGYRIGYGAGFYDRTLPRFCPPASSLCVAFDFQLAAEIPRADGDARVDVVVTDARVLRPA